MGELRRCALKFEVLRAVWDVNARYVTYEADAPLAFAAGRLGVLEIGKKKKKRLRNSKSPHLQAAKAKRCFATASSVLFRQTARRDASPHPAAATERGHPAGGLNVSCHPGRSRVSGLMSARPHPPRPQWSRARHVTYRDR